MISEFSGIVPLYYNRENILIENVPTEVIHAGFDSQQYDRDPITVVLGVIVVTSIIVSFMYVTIKNSVKKNVKDWKDRSEIV